MPRQWTVFLLGVALSNVHHSSSASVHCSTPWANLTSKFFKASDVKECFDSFTIDKNTAEKTKEVMQNYLSMYS